MASVMESTWPIWVPFQELPSQTPKMKSWLFQSLFEMHQYSSSLNIFFCFKHKTHLNWFNVEEAGWFESCFSAINATWSWKSRSVFYLGIGKKPSRPGVSLLGAISMAHLHALDCHLSLSECSFDETRICPLIIQRNPTLSILTKSGPPGLDYLENSSFN